MNKLKTIIVTMGVSVFLASPVLSSANEADSEELRSKFIEAREALIPLNPDEIDNWYQSNMETSEAVNRKPVKGDRVSQTVSLDPGADFPQIVITPGYVTSIRFIDSVGTPWQITSDSVGNRSWFELVKPEGLKPGNLLFLSALSPKAHSNILVTLDGLNEPISISVVTADMVERDGVSGSVTYQVPGMSPDAEPPKFSDPVPHVVSDLLMDVLNNIMPEAAKQMETDNEAVDVWQINGRLYIRTSRQLIWPAFDEQVAGGSLNVYRIPVVSRLMVTDNVAGTVSVGVDL